ncbi:MAG: OmpA family protein [Bacteroidota bacterium]
MKWSISALIFLFGITFLTAQNTFIESVYFDLDQHELTDAAKSTLDQFIQDLQYLEDLEITLRANTDDQGSNFYNKKLGERRARSVRQYLATQKIASKAATVENFGEENPAYSNDNEEGKSKNRRVDIIVSTSSALTLNDLFKEWQQDQSQFYTIDASKDVRLIGENGTNIWIPAGAFVLSDGTIAQGKIEITLKEAYDFSDMLMSDLSTTSDHQLLETGGMIYLEAMVDGQQLNIKEGTALTVGLPGEEFKEDMELFIGEQDALGTVTNWGVTEQPFVPSLEETLNMRPEPRPPFLFRKGYQGRATGKPKKMAVPSKPILPRTPSPETKRFYPNSWQKMFWSKEKIQQKEDELYAKAQERHIQHMEQYERNTKLHAQDLIKYKAHLQSVKDWEAEQRAKVRAFELAQSEKYEAQYELYRIAKEKWHEERLERLAQLEDYEVTGKQALSVVSRYFTSITRLGWINCDRFYSVPEEGKMQLAVNDLDETEERVFVIFNDTKSLLTTYKRDGQYRTSSIPKGENVTIVGLKFQDRKPMLAQLTTTTNPVMTYELEYKACTASEMKAQLSAFN